mmetsp:Transcript_8232/g.20062  ORF Transcript_8232/g.20062 Transcript_8232/m.20062 type:complete len:322 (+) Transcript_8232:106-1071(+)
MMSTRLSALNSPSLVSAAGVAVALGFPYYASLAQSSSLVALSAANVAAFALNVFAVSVPGRMDGEVARKMAEDVSARGADDGKPLDADTGVYTLLRGRSLVAPSGWAFAIWGAIYLGEVAFVGVQCFPSSALADVLPEITAPFVAANIFQSLWCASFRSKYSSGWYKYVSAGMLVGTVAMLSKVAMVGSTSAVPHIFIPLTMHFGWTTAATLVNLNGSLAMDENISDLAVIAAGHASAAVGTALGTGLAVAHSMPAYALTLAWALAACADGMKTRQAPSSDGPRVRLERGASVQRALCSMGAASCALAAGVIALRSWVPPT